MEEFLTKIENAEATAQHLQEMKGRVVLFI
jgi:hypothetical protein